MNNFTSTIERGCGRRVPGDAYLTFGIGTGKHDAPLEEYLICPPKPLDVKKLGLSAIGVKVWEKNGVTHIVDWVGSSHYPNVCDILEEIRRFGVSRKIPRTVLQQIANNHPPLSHQSKLILVHARGFIDNHEEYINARSQDEYWCPLDKPEHLTGTQMCSSLWWEDLQGGQGFDEDNPRFVQVDLPSFYYVGATPPEGVVGKYSPAFIAAFPISRIEVPQDILGNKHLFTRNLAIAASNVKIAVTET